MFPRILIPALFTLLTIPVSATAVAVAGMPDDAILESFLSHVADLEGLDDVGKEQVRDIVDGLKADSPADAITESLIAIYDGYATAIEASDGEDLGQTISLLTPFADSTDPYLSADAAFYLARALMNNEKFENALPLLVKIHGPLSEYTVHEGPARFYKGIAQAGLLQYEQAVASLTDFIQFYPDAPERLRVAAWRQIQQLQSIKAGQMEDIYQRMDYSRRRLSLIEPGEQTQEEQDKIVRMLAKLIKEQEKKEASSKNKNQQKNQQQQQQQQQQANQKRQPSQSQTGGQSSNPNGQVVKKSYNDGPASPWSRLRDRSRDPANNAIKDKLPARYREIVERYYEAANGNSGN